MKFPDRRLRSVWANPLVIGLLAALLAVGAIVLVPLAVMVVRYKIQMEFITRPLALGMLVLPVAYGFLRGFLFHPVFDTRYSRWLANTPWTPEYPLPKGPVHLVWADAVVVGVLAATMYLLSLTIAPPRWPFIVTPVILFALALAVAWSIANWATGQSLFIYSVFWVPVLFVALGIPLIGWFFCPFVMAGVAWLGVRRSLAAFPWTELDRGTANESKPSTTIVGWPYRDLLHETEEFRTTVGKSILEAALVAVWIWFLTRFIAPEDFSAVVLFFAFGAAILALWRTAMYGPIICDNLCWGHRIANKQWIIRRHDQVFLAPLLMLVVAIGLPWTLYRGLGVSTGIAFAAAAGLVVLVGRGMGPSVQQLQYTGVHSKFGHLGPQRKEFITASGSNN